MNCIRRWLLEWAYRLNQVGECDGIALVAAQHCDDFVETIIEAIRLIERTDLRRHSQIKGRLKWIVNQPLLRAGGMYGRLTRACIVDFHRTACGLDREWAAGWCAVLLVHEATHGVIDSRGIHYTQRLRSRIERRCVKEEQRFVARLAESEPEIAAWLTSEFEETHWTPIWNTTRAEEHEWRRAKVVDVFVRAWPEFIREVAQAILGSRVCGRRQRI